MVQYHLGINLGHERAVAIVQDGILKVAIEQERLDRNKFSLGYLLQSAGAADKMQLPAEAIRYCLDACEIQLSDVATITANMPGADFGPNILTRSLPPEVADRAHHIPSHHLAHAYSAYLPSGFDEALILVADASGSTIDHQTESYSLYTGQNGNINTLHSETVTAHLASISTLGFLYEYVTRKSGFVTQVNDKIQHAEAGKLMGLAPFGGHQPNWHRWIQPEADSYSLKLSPYDIFLEINAIEKMYDDGAGKPYLRPHLVDLAYKVQHELEQALLHIVGLAVQKTGLKKLCIAGGVGLNSVANYKLLNELGLDDIFIFPAAGDSGIAAGCALWAYQEIAGGTKRSTLRTADLGKSYSPTEVEQAVAQFAGDIVFEQLSAEQMLERSAEALVQGSIVARYEGGAEYGPRALGQRSIMADPTFLRMKDIINARVKFRESFRPFAPVIPLESIAEVFEQSVAAPFMLVVPKIRPEFQAVIPAVTHVDGTGRVQTVTPNENPYFYQLCHRLVEQRQGPPVLLNTSFNVAGQPIVETPAEAIETFLNTDIDFLALENIWIAKRRVPVLDYEEHLRKVSDSPTPRGLLETAPAATELMQQLDRALFLGETANCPWSMEELRTLSAKGGHFKETSLMFRDSSLPAQFNTHLNQYTVMLLDPLGQSSIIDLREKVPPKAYGFEPVRWILTALQGSVAEIAQLRLESNLSQRELIAKLDWVAQELKPYGLTPQHTGQRQLKPDDTVPPNMASSITGTKTLAPFADEGFSLQHRLKDLYDRLKQANYTAATIAALLQVESLQHIEPTRLHYYDRHLLAQDKLGDLIRLFQLRVALPEQRLLAIFGHDLLVTLQNLGILIPRDEQWAARIDIFDVAGLYIATDHRYMVLAEDSQMDESPVMYIGMDSMGLVHTAPHYPVNRVLDLCSGSGIQGLIASRYAQQVISVDINPRAIRFSRFNAQLNGINNIEFQLGNLYAAVPGQKFDTILANPPFVPSPTKGFRFRDGGANGEEILRAIVEGSPNNLQPDGRLFIVTDLVDIVDYEAKLDQWWVGGAAHKLVLGTADRDDILFSVPHSHAAFGQTFEQYNQELDKWVNNFHNAGLTAVNFGYILLQRLPNQTTGSYYKRTIHNPSQPIHTAVQTYFQQRQYFAQAEVGEGMQVSIAPDMRFRVESGIDDEGLNVEIFAPENPYFTTYPICEALYYLLQEISNGEPNWSQVAVGEQQAVLQDLLFKGILQLAPANAKHADLKIPQLWQIGRPMGRSTVKSTRLATPSSESNLSISELQTKTTPTCLSSYL
ncbi:methyltransferase [filamentous cyanobacterium LEGE 11480]|uniref:Methyltransferase n=1 Tax=Romeriopsis navalis LEGE 11480 TaxID=2777977 RepID=A0A928Z4G2_9CYAN|nr:carbamoyltransferase C-terminal domain-containing protein [Romeriopsis navalis]MBE9031744.1 methyltransferase [Romeriopsis navalis LEGE 11480]